MYERQSSECEHDLCLANPRMPCLTCSVESGVLHALVLFTFLVPWNDGSEPGWALHGFTASHGHSCGCCALLPGGKHAVTMIGT